MEKKDADRTLLQQFRSGNQNSFEEFYDRHEAGLYHFILATTKDPHMAEEVLQQLFLLVYTKTNLFLNALHLKSYLYTSARNIMRNLLRSKKQEHSLLHRQASVGLRVQEEHPDSSVEIKKELSSALNRLSVQQREVILLHSYEGMTFKQISEVTTTSERTLFRRYHSALGVLKRELGEFY